MVKESGCKPESETVDSTPPTDIQNTDVLEKTNPRQHLPVTDSVPPMSTLDVGSCIENADSSAHAVCSVPASTDSAA